MFSKFFHSLIPAVVSVSCIASMVHAGQIASPSENRASATRDFPQIITFEDLMRLSPEKRADYLNGLRQMLAEMAKASDGKNGTGLVADTQAEVNRGLQLLEIFMPWADARDEILNDQGQVVQLRPAQAAPAAPSAAAPGPGPGSRPRRSAEEVVRDNAGAPTLNDQGQPIVDGVPLNPPRTRGVIVPPDIGDRRMEVNPLTQPPGPSRPQGGAQADSPAAPTAANRCEPPATELACNGTPGQRRQAFRAKLRGSPNDNKCVYAGFVSTVRGARAGNSTCQRPSNEFPVASGAPLSCGRGETLCNPLVFGIEASGKAFCIGAQERQSATANCLAKSNSKPRMTNFLSTNAQVFQAKWNEFRDDFNKVCGSVPESRQYHCEECTVIWSRLHHLNLTVTGASCGVAEAGALARATDAEGAVQKIRGSAAPAAAAPPVAVQPAPGAVSPPPAAQPGPTGEPAGGAAGRRPAQRPAALPPGVVPAAVRATR